MQRVTGSCPKMAAVRETELLVKNFLRKVVDKQVNPAYKQSPHGGS